ncbi:LAMI_0B03114g1_1 [Lachancea mirantina]|uniref:LAMI_0B03114g1_1 n=1 Tax=Lachancea mirantina TaxID=1230905 RepID=A0A1G4IUI2_9SACH|nr:LAMI_0B03114g1_1 [Lachancea mirantina]
MLPPEIIYQILSHQFHDIMSNDYPSGPEKFSSNIQIFLRSNLTVNKTFYHVCKVLCYRYVSFTSARGFNKLLETLRQNSKLVHYVQVVDFEELTSIGLGRTGEMNKNIKNLTSDTLLEFLQLTGKNLREFLASEHIQGDMDERIIRVLLSGENALSVFDLCGCSRRDFSEAFQNAVDRLYRNGEIIAYNYQLTCLGLHECSVISSHTLGKLLKVLPELQKLDLGRTSIDDHTLINDLPHLKNLTHLSLAMCSQLTPRGVLEFFSYHPSATDENNLATFQWLNLQVHPHSSSWTDTQTNFLLRKLCRYGHNKTLQYLNIGGMPLHQSDDSSVVKTSYYWKCQSGLATIKWNFPKLKALSIRDNDIPVPDLVHFLSVPQRMEDDLDFKPPRLKFLNVANNAYVNRWSIQDPILLTCSETLSSLELSFEPWQQIEASNSRHEIVGRMTKPGSFIQDFSTAEMVKWRCFIDSAYGRRYWLYKTDPYLNREDLDSFANITRYDSEGNRIIDIVRQPDFLKFAQNKIMLGCGIVSQSSIRRNLEYRDVKPQISRFFDRDGKISSGTQPVAITVPPMAPGGWLIMENEEWQAPNSASLLPASSDNEDARSESPARASSRGLYWDRSIPDLPQYLTTHESDADYMEMPELQRRRSQLSLLGFRAHKKHSVVSSSLFNERFLNSSSNDTLINKRDNLSEAYRKHIDVAEEYEVFGCIERGIYRYYSLKV